MKDSNWFASWFDTHYYHVLYQDRNHREAELFIGHLLDFLKLPQNSYLLDLACGKGRHAITMSEHGYKVLGVDLSEKSIAHATQMSNENLKFRVHDMREVIPNEQFDAVFNLFTSFGYFNDWEDNLRTLHAIHEMLHTKGILVIDFMNVKKVLAQLVEKETKIVEEIVFKIHRKRDEHYLYKHIEFDHQGEKHRHTERVQLLDLQHFQQLFEQTNFEYMRAFGDYHLNEFNPITSNRLILLARKK